VTHLNLQMRLDHLEVTFPKGTLTDDFRAEVDAFYSGVLGWSSQAMSVFGGDCHRLRIDDGQFIMLAESEYPQAEPVDAVGDRPGQTMFVPHLGITLDTVDNVRELTAACRRFQEADERLRLKEFPLETYFDPNAASQGLLFMYLLPIWFDVHSRWWKPGHEPSKHYRYWCYASVQ
jgi:hypothetical protein